MSIIHTRSSIISLQNIFCFTKSCYRPQRSCGQGNVFTGVCLSTGGGRVSASVHAGMPYPPGWRAPPMESPPRWRTPPGWRPPLDGEPPRDGEPPPDGEPQPPPRMEKPPPEADSSIRSTSGRYASYWNAFLFYIVLLGLKERFSLAQEKKPNLLCISSNLDTVKTDIDGCKLTLMKCLPHDRNEKSLIKHI